MDSANNKETGTNAQAQTNIAANPAEMDASIQTSVQNPSLRSFQKRGAVLAQKSGRSSPTPAASDQAFLAASRAAAPPSKGFGTACFSGTDIEEGALLAAFLGLTRPELGPSAWASSHLAWTSETQQIWHSKVPRPRLCNPKFLEDLIASAQGQAILVFSLRCSEALQAYLSCMCACSIKAKEKHESCSITQAQTSMNASLVRPQTTS